MKRVELSFDSMLTVCARERGERSGETIGFVSDSKHSAFFTQLRSHPPRDSFIRILYYEKIHPNRYATTMLLTSIRGFFV